MIKLIKSNRVSIKNNSQSCTINEYIFNQPSIGIAQALINGRYPTEHDKKVINCESDIIYFVLGGSGVVHTSADDFMLEPNDALLITHGNWYWVEGNNLKILVISSPEWQVVQYKEV
ncbi:MAG: hypothetical protein WC365_07070 [Candidatus Babeliales bacterium]|jgi:hypothetical protein